MIVMMIDTISGLLHAFDDKVFREAAAGVCYTKEEIDRKVASVLTWKGSVATKSDLPAASKNKVGDTWNVKDSGFEYTWTEAGKWEELGPVLDLSAYYTKSQIDALIGSVPAGKTLMDIIGLDGSEGKSLKQYVDDLATKVDEHTASISALETTVNGYSTKITALETSVSTATDNITSLTDKVSTNEKAIADVKSTADTAKASVDDLTTKVATVEGDVKTNSDNITKLSTDLSTVSSDVAANKTAISQEAADRLSEDTALSKRIDAEVAARTDADTTLDKRITANADAIVTETNARTTESTSIKASISDETQARTDADTGLGERIDAVEESVNNEVSDRTTADKTLDDKITAEKNARATAESALGTRVDNEASARSTADATLQSNIDAETTARGSADTTLQGNIDTEASTRAAADTALETKISTEVTDRKTAVNDALTEAKSYADTVSAKAMFFEGSVADRAALEAVVNPSKGAMYNVESYTFDDGTTVTGANFAWTGTEWDKLSETIDLTPFAKKTDVNTAISGVETKVTTEATDRTAAVKTVSDNLATEVTAREALATKQTVLDADQATIDTIDTTVKYIATSDEKFLRFKSYYKLAEDGSYTKLELGTDYTAQQLVSEIADTVYEQDGWCLQDLLAGTNSSIGVINKLIPAHK